MAQRLKVQLCYTDNGRLRLLCTVKGRAFTCIITPPFLKNTLLTCLANNPDIELIEVQPETVDWQEVKLVSADQFIYGIQAELGKPLVPPDTGRSTEQVEAKFVRLDDPPPHLAPPQRENREETKRIRAVISSLQFLVPRDGEQLIERLHTELNAALAEDNHSLAEQIVRRIQHLRREFSYR